MKNVSFTGTLAPSTANYPSGDMTANVQYGCTATQSSQYDATYPPWTFFGGAGQNWVSDSYVTPPASPPVTANKTNVGGTLIPGEWEQLQVPTPIILTSYTFGCVTWTYGWMVVGSMDNVNWSLIDQKTQGVIDGPWTFVVTPTSPFSYFRFIVTLGVSGTTYVNLDNCKFTGYPYIGSPTATYPGVVMSYRHSELVHGNRELAVQHHLHTQ